MKLLFVADPIESFKTYKDTTYTMMREATRRGHAITVCEPRHLRWQSGQRVMAQVRDIALTGDEKNWFTESARREAALADFDAVLMRKDPPFDAEFIYATHLLEQAEREGACVINQPAALRNHPEKLAVMEFPQFVGPTLVTRSADDKAAKCAATVPSSPRTIGPVSAAAGGIAATLSTLCRIRFTTNSRDKASGSASGCSRFCA